MFTNIEKELKKQKTTLMKDFDSDKVLQQIKLLEQGEAAEDLRIANGLGRQHSLAVAQDRKSLQIELEKLDTKYNGGVFTSDQIKELCARYDLVLRKSKYYTGIMDLGVISAIKVFAKETKTEINEATLKYNFYIMAPLNLFEREPRTTYGRGLLNKYRDFMESLRDPAIFYKVDDNRYRLIKKWGKDFTIMRLLRGFYFRNLFNAVISDIVMFTFLGIGICKAFAKFVPSWWNAPETKNWISGESAIISATTIACLIGFFIYVAHHAKEDFHAGKWFKRYED